ncbi:MAG: response regulator transcription factor [Bacteroidota bacterium]|mgnify:CR=1 FL=1
MSETINIILADDHELVRNGLRLLLETEQHIQVIGEAADGEETVALAGKLKPHVAIVDIRMPKLNGIQATQQLKAKFPLTKVLVLTMHEDEEYITQSVDSGADGYLLKDTGKEEFLKAIHTVHSGQKYFSGDISSILVERYLSAKNVPAAVSPSELEDKDYGLTKREKQLLRMIYEGVSNKDIADQLDKSIRTVETHRFNIMKKLEVNNIAELLRKIDQEPALKDSLLT